MTTSNGQDAAREAIESLARRARVAIDDDREGSHLHVLRLSDVEPERVRWLWPARIPVGKLTMLDADPGIGKSTIMIDIAARLTVGSAMPDGERGDVEGPCSVVFLTAEDGAADTVRPRFDASGGDPARAVLLPALVLADGRQRLPELPTDLEPIQEVVVNENAVMVVVDVLMAYLADNVETRSDHKVRRALSQLSKLAEDTGVAVVALRHLNKSGGGNALYRGGGSIAFSGQARSVLMAAEDPETEGQRVLASVKCNLAPRATSLIFTVEGAPNGAARIVWGGATDRTADDLLGAHGAGEGQASTDTEDLLRDLLADGPVPAGEVLAAGRRSGIADKALRRAATKLGVTQKREGFGPGSVVQWSLPSTPILGIRPRSLIAESMPSMASLNGSAGDHESWPLGSDSP